ncbi:MAG: hypothetical protein HY785_22615 [Oscillatoriophycideae cyanobacterium NC_groundwater_1537_Pr4_S-0.65um_50_18]|nr:hypothetical protein [Oscillatoriophycideae cyanobacterium NC_groundwater_1537_Pr4_S-0.65um_50_18]
MGTGLFQNSRYTGYRCDRLQQLNEQLEESTTERLVPVVGDMSNVEPAEQLRQQILDKVGRIVQTNSL